MKIRIPIGMKSVGKGLGASVHISRIRIKDIIGLIINTIIFAAERVSGSLMISFSASANGWGIPIKLTLLGPFRSCKKPRTFRSKRVKNAIVIRAISVIVIRWAKGGR